MYYDNYYNYGHTTFDTDTRQRALRNRNLFAMGFVMKVLWQDHTFVMKCTLNALCLLSLIMYNHVICLLIT